MIEYKGILAPPGFKDSIQEVSHLRRTIRWTMKGIEREHDRKHIDQILQFIGLALGSKVTARLVRERLEDGHDMSGEDNDPDVAPDEVTSYRSCAMTVAYDAQDRTVRELAKARSYVYVEAMCSLLKACTDSFPIVHV